MMSTDPFVRFPTRLVEALLRTPLSGVQWRIVLWVIRRTLGWNRETTAFSWYRLAIELALDRGGVVRAGHVLLDSRILYLKNGEIGIEQDHLLWLCARARPSEPGATTVSADRNQRKAMMGIIVSDDGGQRERCLESSLFRRAKDSSKERLKKYIHKPAPARGSHDAGQRFRNGASNERHLAGEARPVPGKYDNVSQA